MFKASEERPGWVEWHLPAPLGAMAASWDLSLLFAQLIRKRMLAIEAPDQP